MKQPKKTAKMPPHTKAIETTGHVWDGIEELNNPLPRWWLWIFYATIIWGIGYMIVYPAIPLLRQATQGVFGYDSRLELQQDLASWQARNAALDERLVNRDLTSIADDPELAHYAFTGGGAVFRTYCEQCHGAGAKGSKGYPNLLDDDWLWGGDIEAIAHTITHGVRVEDDDDTRFSEMPAFADLLSSEEIIDVTHYTLSLSGVPHNPVYVPSGRAVFAENCADCHGEYGQGDREFGAPNLTDSLSLYGHDHLSVAETIANARNGVMPAWADRLSPSQLRQVAFYVHQLGGGE